MPYQTEDIRLKDKINSINWAKNLLAGKYGDWVILDTETTGLYGAEVIEIAVISKYGSTMLNTRIKPTIPIEEGAIAVHGISEEDLKDAPEFKDIYPRLKQVIENKKVVIYNKNFDVRVIFNSIKAAGLPRINYDFDCAMTKYAAFVNHWSDYWGNYKWQKLPNANHSAVGDCIATYNLIKEMANVDTNIFNQIDKHSELFPLIQIGCKWERHMVISLNWRFYPYGWDKNLFRFTIAIPKFFIMR
jgi:DNA polymerase III subunit epsilon